MTARIDSLLVVSGFVFAVLVLPRVAERVTLDVRRAATFAAGVVLAGGIGLFVGYERSPAYVSDLSSQMKTQILVVGAVLVGIVVVNVAGAVLPRFAPARRVFQDRRVAYATGVAVVVVGIVYWTVVPAMTEFRKSATNGLVQALQTREGVEVDPHRSYGEEALRRLGMHFGPVLVFLAVLGAGLVVYELVRRREAKLWMVAAFGLPSLPYLILPNIAADMPWALRRFLPVIIPAMLLLAAVALARVQVASKGFPLLVPSALLVVAVVPLTVTWPVVTVRGEANTLGYTQAMCREIPDDAYVFVAHSGLQVRAVQTLELFCGNEVLTSKPDTYDEVLLYVLDVAEQSGRGLVVLATADYEFPAGVVETSRVTLGGSFTFVERTVERPPSGADTTVSSVEVVGVTSSGG